jgi:sarcosine oxidase
LLERIVDAKTCLYSITPDEDFVIDKIKQHPQVIVLSACSGHGFKFAVLTGKMAADLAAKERTDQANDLFLLSRFVGLPV